MDGHHPQAASGAEHDAHAQDQSQAEHQQQSLAVVHQEVHHPAQEEAQQPMDVDAAAAAHAQAHAQPQEQATVEHQQQYEYHDTVDQHQAYVDSAHHQQVDAVAVAHQQQQQADAAAAQHHAEHHAQQHQQQAQTDQGQMHALAQWATAEVEHGSAEAEAAAAEQQQQAALTATPVEQHHQVQHHQVDADAGEPQYEVAHQQHPQAVQHLEHDAAVQHAHHEQHQDQDQAPQQYEEHQVAAHHQDPNAATAPAQAAHQLHPEQHDVAPPPVPMMPADHSAEAQAQAHAQQHQHQMAPQEQVQEEHVAQQMLDAHGQAHQAHPQSQAEVQHDDDAHNQQAHQVQHDQDLQQVQVQHPHDVHAQHHAQAQVQDQAAVAAAAAAAGAAGVHPPHPADIAAALAATHHGVVGTVPPEQQQAYETQQSLKRKREEDEQQHHHLHQQHRHHHEGHVDVEVEAEAAVHAHAMAQAHHPEERAVQYADSITEGVAAGLAHAASIDGLTVAQVEEELSKYDDDGADSNDTDQDKSGDPNHIEDCDVLTNKSIMQHVPAVKGKGALHPPWTWRTSQRKVREWRRVPRERQAEEKAKWKDLGQAEQDDICRRIRVKYQTRSLRLSSKDKSVTYSASKRLTAARSDFDSACERKRSAEREIDDARRNLERAQHRLREAIAHNDSLDGSIDRAKAGLDQAELSEPTDWTEMYNRLGEYRRAHSHCNVPISKSNPPDLKRLATWMVRQRACYRNYRDPPENPDGTLQQVSIGSLNAQKIDALEKIGFVWDTKDHQWRKMYQELVQYKREHGNLRINFNTHRPLYRWADRQKLQYVILKKGEPSLLTPERVRLLQSVDFPWWKDSENAAPTFDRSDAWWDRQYAELRRFRDNYGHVRISRNQGATVKDEKVSFRLVEFGTWNRKQYKMWKAGGDDKARCRLSDERIRLLRELGFEFDPHARVRDSISGGTSGSANGGGNGGGGAPSTRSVESDVNGEDYEMVIKEEEEEGDIMEEDGNDHDDEAAPPPPPSPEEPKEEGVEAAATGAGVAVKTDAIVPTGEGDGHGVGIDVGEAAAASPPHDAEGNEKGVPSVTVGGHEDDIEDTATAQEEAEQDAAAAVSTETNQNGEEAAPPVDAAQELLHGGEQSGVAVSEVDADADAADREGTDASMKDGTEEELGDARAEV